MKQYTVEISDGENRVLESWLGGETEIQEWVQHALKNKARKRLDATIEEVTDRNPKKLTEQEKIDLIKDVLLPTRAERDERAKKI